MNFKLITTVLLFLMACTENDNTDSASNNENRLARIISVSASGSVNNYIFSVGIESPDTGCDQYADWWEVISEDGELIYRRILAHSHVNEQPFVRFGGAVKISNTQNVYIRAHMNTTGYGTQVYRGSISNGFTKFELDKNFAKDLETSAPLPNGCAF
ncbi:hypothetical protein GTQ40_17220 [Flavobacteriaceae bacterium R38]|nr:hypothetical protein [Flavobacteriaceae bacterium R38]